jgi:hypothetical protein
MRQTVTRYNEGLKWCPRCKQYKPLADFYTISESKCIECKKAQRKKDYAALTDEQKAARLARRNNPEYKLGSKVRSDRHKLSFSPEEFSQKQRAAILKHRYKITPEEYDRMLESQGNGCALCGRLEEDVKLSVDHDHSCCPGRNSCGKCVRGLLCMRCNAMLGVLESFPEMIPKVLAYLKV